MLTNEFQSMIEQYSNDLMSISKNAEKNVDCTPSGVQTGVGSVIQNVQQNPMPQTDNNYNDSIPDIQPDTNWNNGNNLPNTEQNTMPQMNDNNDGAPNIPQSTFPTSPLPSRPMDPNSEMPQDSYRAEQQLQNTTHNTSQNTTGNMNSSNNISSSETIMRDKYVDNSQNMTYEQFLLSNPDSGYLRVQVFSGNQVSPISGAEVIVSKEFIDGRQIFFQGLTDISGIVDNIELPAPSKDISETPQPRGDGVQMRMPYSQYNITVQERMHVDQEYTHVPIFSGIKSIQPVRMTPLQFGNGSENNTIVFTESEPNDL